MIAFKVLNFNYALWHVNPFCAENCVEQLAF